MPLLPSGVRGELPVSSEPKLRESGLTNPLVPVSVPDSCSEITSMSLSKSNIFFFERVLRLTVLRRRRVENIPSPLPLEFLFLVSGLVREDKGTSVNSESEGLGDGLDILEGGISGVREGDPGVYGGPLGGQDIGRD